MKTGTPGLAKFFRGEKHNALTVCAIRDPLSCVIPHRTRMFKVKTELILTIGLAIRGKRNNENKATVCN